MHNHLSILSVMCLLPGQALAHGDHGQELSALLHHLVSDLFHLWPLMLGVVVAVVLGAVLQRFGRNNP
jgi:hypothetical protein